MTDATKFGHDQLGHILVDYLLQVPRFQRSFSWDEGNVHEFLADLESARARNVDYFMGTAVFARPPDMTENRRQIVDGQQRLATTAILYIAIRDELRRHSRQNQAAELEKRFLRGYVISADEVLERLILNGDDITYYSQLLDGTLPDSPHSSNRIHDAYGVCIEHLKQVMGPDDRWQALIEISEQLENRVQVLVAEATDLPEAYVIFETLNDRGADLTTGDLLKNYLFSSASSYFNFVETKWLQLEGAFDKPDDLVKFIRYEYVSRHGYTTNRRLYRAIQGEVAGGASRAKEYVSRLARAQEVYSALRDPENDFWVASHVDVRDALYAYRRFGFESSFPVLMAVFATWPRKHADKLLIKMAKWSIRAQVAGTLGGGTADETFGAIAAEVNSGASKNQTAIRVSMGRLIPNDEEFKVAFISYGDVTTSRAKYMLAMLEKADDDSRGRPEKPLEWHSRSVTIEHILPLSATKANADNLSVVQKIGNLALLEKKLNKDLGSKHFLDKKSTYREPAFELTGRLSNKRTWNRRSIANRTRELADLACRAWPQD